MRIFQAVVLFSCSFAVIASAQTVEVDTTHPTNHFIPRETLGAGVDRIAVEAIDKDLQQPTLAQTQESGWQPVTYRQNTELAVRLGTGIRRERGAIRRGRDISWVHRPPRRCSVIPMATVCRAAASLEMMERITLAFHG